MDTDSKVSEASTCLDMAKPRGVYETSWGGKFFSQIRRGGKLYYLGTYPDIESAAEAYKSAAEEYERMQSSA